MTITGMGGGRVQEGESLALTWWKFFARPTGESPGPLYPIFPNTDIKQGWCSSMQPLAGPLPPGYMSRGMAEPPGDNNPYPIRRARDRPLVGFQHFSMITMVSCQLAPRFL